MTCDANIQRETREVFRGDECNALDSLMVQVRHIPTYEELAATVRSIPELRPGGFLFEVQVMNYGEFSQEIVDRSVRKYRLGETTPIVKLANAVIGEWGYSFHHLKGLRDGSGVLHDGGYSRPPATREEGLEVIHNYVIKFVQDRPHPWISFNGHYPYHHYAAEWGFDIIGSEIGENINNYQMMIAFNRGAARQYNKAWFVDVSPWHGPGVTDYSKLRPWHEYGGADYGHSLSLYRRTYYMAYMAGAKAIVAEGGGVNFFLEERDEEGCFVPSPLGKIGQEFFDFTQRHPEPGIPYIPFGIVVDYYHGSYSGTSSDLETTPEKFVFQHFPYNAGDYMTWELLDLFFPTGWEVMGRREAGTLVHTPFGDTCDILLSNAPSEVLKGYPVLMLSGDIQLDSEGAQKLIDYVENGGVLLVNSAYVSQFPQWLIEGLTWDTTYSGKKVGKGTVFIYGPEYDICTYGKELIEKLSERLIPFRISGQVEYLLNRRPNSWVVTVINNEGITKDYRKSAVVDKTESQCVHITYVGQNQILKVDEWISGTKLELETSSKDVAVKLCLPPGELAICEFVLRD